MWKYIFCSVPEDFYISVTSIHFVAQTLLKSTSGVVTEHEQRAQWSMDKDIDI